MEIHKPKPIHGWRDFIKEIGSIVLGVSIALAAEQGVEWWHWEHELRETRQALRAELARAVGSFQYNIGVQDCSDRRLKEFAHWLDNSKPGDRLPAIQPTGGPPDYTLLFGAWEVAKSGQAAWRMPLAERLRYAHLYGSLSRFLERNSGNDTIWSQIAQFTGAEPLDHADRMRLRGLIGNAQTMGIILRSFGPYIMPDVRALAITPEKRPVMEPAQTRSFCQPLFVR